MTLKHASMAAAALLWFGCADAPLESNRSVRASTTDPDLLITSVSGPNSVDFGQSFAATVRVCNDSNNYASATDLQLSFSSDTTIDPMDPLAGNGWLQGLDPHQCADILINGWSPYSPTSEQYLTAVVDPMNTVIEDDESNNGFIGPAIGLGLGPDLVVTHIDTPLVAGTGFEATATVCNQGTDYAMGFDVTFYASADTTIVTLMNPNPDFPLGNIYVSSLNPGDCQDTPLMLSAPLTGEFYIATVVDEYNGTIELLESNNTFVGERVGFGSGPELVVTDIAAPPSAQGAFDVALTACNLGDVGAPGADVAIYASADEIITPVGLPGGDFGVGFTYLPSMAPGACQTVTVSAFAGPPGAYYLGAIIDEQNYIPELLESNNTLVGELIGFGYGPDLIVSAVTGPPSANGPFDISVTTCNQGTAPSSGADVTIYASEDTTITPFTGPYPGPDFPLAWVYSTPLQPGQCDTQIANAYPGPQGAYYLGAVVDEQNYEAELIESNNTQVGALTGFGHGSDLVITTIDAPPSADGPFDVTVTACNQGTAASGGSDVTIYASADTTITSAMGQPYMVDYPLGNLPISGLQPGECRAETATVYPFQMGALYVGALIDENNLEAELIESNNDFVGDLMGFGPGADLIVTAISAPPSAQGPFSIGVTVCNQGTTPSSPVDVGIYATEDTIVTPPIAGPGADYPVGYAPVAALLPGECRTETAMGYPPPNGPMFLAALVDEQNYEPELIESNNTFIGQLMGFGSGPDMVITSISAPPSADTAFTVDVTACNQGTTNSGGVDVALYASEDTTITSQFNLPYPSPDFPLGYAYLGPVSAGQCLTVTVNAQLPPQGPVFIGGIVDEANTEGELIESNNTHIGNLMGIGYGSDLVAGPLSAPPFASPSSSLAVSVELCNQGTAPSGPTDAALVASIDAQLDAMGPTPDWIVGNTLVPPLAAGACHLAIVTGPAPWAEGTYNLGLVIDAYNTEPELIESNNAQVALQMEVATTFCGNGIIDAFEFCDDGNFNSGDGCTSQCQIEQMSWQQIASGNQYTNVNWDYAMGYHFSPMIDGQITALGGFFTGTKTVRLFERATGTLLAETAVSASNTWGYGEITPVSVSAGVEYTVAVYLAGSGGSYRWGAGSMPQSSGDVQILGTTWTPTGTNPDARPVNNYTYGYMFGQADIAFVPTLP